jgi:hypothetical protein
MIELLLLRVLEIPLSRENIFMISENGSGIISEA